MGSWSVRVASLVLPLATLAPVSATAASTQVVPVIFGHALVGASPRYVKLSCALDRPLAASTARVTYGTSAYPGHGGKVVHVVPPHDAANAYGVVVTAPISGLSRLSIHADGVHGMAVPVVQYATVGGATIVGALLYGNSGTGWTTFTGLDRPLNWMRYAHGTPVAQGSASLAAILAKYPATSAAAVGFTFGCDAADHDFELDDLAITRTTGSRAYAFETSAVATSIALRAPHHVRVGKRMEVRGALTPAAAGIPVGIYAVKHHKRHLLRTVRTNGAGRFSLRLRFKHAGRVVWSAAVLPKQHWVTGVSGTRKLTVKPKPKPKPKPHPAPGPPPTTPAPPPPSTGSGSGSTPPPSGCTEVICSG